MRLTLLMTVFVLASIVPAVAQAQSGTYLMRQKIPKVTTAGAAAPSPTTWSCETPVPNTWGGTKSRVAIGTAASAVAARTICENYASPTKKQGACTYESDTKRVSFAEGETAKPYNSFSELHQGICASR